MVIDGVCVYGQASRRKAFVISYRLERIARSPSHLQYLLIGRERESSLPVIRYSHISSLQHNGRRFSIGMILKHGYIDDIWR